MRVSPSFVLGCLLLWTAAVTPATAAKPKKVPANKIPGSTSGATIVLTPKGSTAKLYIDGQKIGVYKGGVIPGITSAAIYTAGGSNIFTNLGTVTAGVDGSLSMTIVKAPSNRTLILDSNSNFTAGGTLSLGTGSTVSLASTLTDTNGITINSGAVFTAAGTSTLNAGVTFTGITNTSLTSAGTLRVGSGDIVTPGATLTLGSNSTINDGLLTFGTDGTINAGGLIKAGTGSTILSDVNFTVNNGTITDVPVSGGIIISNTTGTLTGGTLTLGTTDTLNKLIVNGSLGGLNLNTLGAVTINGSGIGNLNFFNGTNGLSLTAPSTITIASTLPLLNRTVTVPVSTKLTVNVTAGMPLKSIPSIRLATADATTPTTTTSFLDGLDTNGGSVSILYLPAVQDLLSNPISIHLSELDTPGVQEKFVLQMSFDAAAASSLGNLPNLYLAWFDPADGTWKNAVDGNSDGGAGGQPVAGAYDPTADFNLGWYGVDTTNSTLWAVIDHDGEFAANGLASVTHTTLAIHSQTPEPSTAALLVCGLGLLGRRSRRQR